MFMRTVENIDISISATGTTYSRIIAINDTTEKVAVFVNTTAAGGTLPTLNITPLWSVDGGTVWFDAEDAAASVLALAEISAVSKKQKQLDALAPLIKFKFVAGGTSPTFTATLAVVEYGAA